MAIIVTAKPPKRRKGLTPVIRLKKPKTPTPEEVAEADRRATEFVEKMLADARDARAFVMSQRPEPPANDSTGVVASRTSRQRRSS